MQRHIELEDWTDPEAHRVQGLDRYRSTHSPKIGQIWKHIEDWADLEPHESVI